MRTIGIGPTSVLLFTPVPFDHRIWRDLDELLGQQLTISVVTWPGYDEHRPIPFDQCAVALEVARDTDSLDGVVTFGLDAAAGVAVAATMSRGRLMLVDAMPDGPLADVADDAEARVQQGIDALPDGLAEALAEGDSPRIGELVAQAYSSWLSEADQRLIQDIVTDNAWAFEALPRTIARRQAWPEQLADLRTRVLMVARESPTTGGPHLAYADALAARCRDAQVATLPVDSDVPWLESPGRFADLVSEFFTPTAG